MTESAKVVSLRGGEILPPGEPRPAVVEALERALEAARSGEIIGVVAVFNHCDDTTTGASQGRRDRQTIGMLEIMKAGLVERDQRDD